MFQKINEFSPSPLSHPDPDPGPDLGSESGINRICIRTRIRKKKIENLKFKIEN